MTTTTTQPPTEKIKARLESIERSKGVRILYACESGSRAWGFASEDSDYDIRFLYLRPTEDYLSVRERRDTMEFAIDDDLLDLAGWDVRKALGLFAKSNGALLEWLHSPQVYLTDSEPMNLWRSLVPDVLNPKALAGHYLGMARKTWIGSLQKPEIRLKRLLYALRALLAAHWVLQRRLPAPVRFEKLLEYSNLEAPVRDRIENLLEAKRRVSESDTMKPDLLLHAFIEQQLFKLTNEQQAVLPRQVEMKLIDAFFQRLVKQTV